MRTPNMENRKREIRKQGDVWQYVESSCQCGRVLRVLLEEADLFDLKAQVQGWEEAENSQEYKDRETEHANFIRSLRRRIPIDQYAKRVELRNNNRRNS